MIRLLLISTLATVASVEKWNWLTVIAATALLFTIGERRAKRRGVGGLQNFGNYYVGWLTLKIETLLKVYGIILLLIGLYHLIKQ